jgi:hypothetical protein
LRTSLNSTFRGWRVFLNSPTPSPAEQANGSIRESRNELQRIQAVLFTVPGPRGDGS